MARAKHPLTVYIEKEGISQIELARRAHISSPMVPLIINGQREAGRRVAHAIWKATNTEVTAHDLWEWTEAEARRSRRRNKVDV